MEKNRFTTYLLYAIGEIFLVVIGILIAVSINDWNASRKQKLVEKNYFQNMKNDLRADLEYLDNMSVYSIGKVTASQNMKRRMKKDSVGSLYLFSNDLLTLIFTDEFKPNQNTYNEMQSSGNFSGIQNDSLKLKLLALNQTYESINSFQEHVRNDFNVFLEDFEQYVDWGSYYKNVEAALPAVEMKFDSLYIQNHRAEMEREAKALFESKVFKNNIFLYEVNFTYFIDFLEQTKPKLEEIIDILDEEINQL